MQTSRRRAAALATAAVLSLSSLTATPAPAEAYTNPSQSSSSQSSSDKRRTYFYEISQLPFIATGILRLLTGVLGLPGFHLINIGQFFQEIPENFPYPVDASITEVKLVSREVADYPRSQERRLERWTVASPSMGRNIAVDVRLPKPGGEPAPTLVMLDGVEAPLHSGWLNERSGNDFDRVLGEENVTVVFPLDANRSGRPSLPRSFCRCWNPSQTSTQMANARSVGYPWAQLVQSKPRIRTPTCSTPPSASPVATPR